MLIKKIIKKILIVMGVFIINIFTRSKPLKKDMIIFESYFGRSVSDSPFAIYEYLNKERYNCIFLVNDPKEYPNIKTVKRNTLKAYYYMRIAKVIVNNQRMPSYWKKREDQIYFQTWHGTPLKKLVHDLDAFNMPSASSIEDYTKMFDEDIKKWDYLLSVCPYATKCFRSAFKFKGNILEIGYPRNDKLYNCSTSEIDLIKSNLKIPLNKKVILYAPTYREDQNYGVGKYYFNTELDFKKLKKEFPDYVIIIRYHYIITKTDDLNDENVIDVSDYPDISDLYLISDILITDYSSVFFDFSILKKPFLFFAYDIEKYRDDLRGFYLDMYHDFPVKPVKTTDELIEQIKNIDMYDFSSFSEIYNPSKNNNTKEEFLKVFDEIIMK